MQLVSIYLIKKRFDALVNLQVILNTSVYPRHLYTSYLCFIRSPPHLEYRISWLSGHVHTGNWNSSVCTPPQCISISGKQWLQCACRTIHIPGDQHCMLNLFLIKDGSEYKKPLHLVVVNRYLQQMGDEIIRRSLFWNRFIPHEMQVSIYCNQGVVNSIPRSAIKAYFKVKTRRYQHVAVCRIIIIHNIPAQQRIFSLLGRYLLHCQPGSMVYNTLTVSLYRWYFYESLHLKLTITP